MEIEDPARVIVCLWPFLEELVKGMEPIGADFVLNALTPRQTLYLKKLDSCIQLIVQRLSAQHIHIKFLDGQQEKCLPFGTCMTLKTITQFTALRCHLFRTMS